MPQKKRSYSVIDLFAGPGGLGEGFAALKHNNGQSVFESVASVEVDESAHRTLTLRHFFRQFREGEVPDAYYDYVSGNISKDDLVERYPAQWESASASSLNIALGYDNHELVRKVIKKRLGKTSKWVLVGGPPCQAYSLVGRSRMMGMDDFEKDARHFLYKEYLKIIVDHQPPVFVMENVKGLLSSKVNGELVIQKIVNDLSSPVKAVTRKHNGLRYRLFSLSSEGLLSENFDPSEFIVKAEKYGVPQARHRMFIVGIRDDIDVRPSSLTPSDAPNLRAVIGGLPKIRSGISKGCDSSERWRSILSVATDRRWFAQVTEGNDSKLVAKLESLISKVTTAPQRKSATTYKQESSMGGWFYDERLKTLLSHNSRSHMPSDIHRYLFASAYAAVHRVSPKLYNFPASLLPNHKSASRKKKESAFSDRFRVQLGSRVATTITSHISKDGHYFIHFDPVQCRSLTVREAARIQTFPDNYHFEGNRTSQYHQIGNAVPPYLAYQIAEIIKEVMDAIDD